MSHAEGQVGLRVKLWHTVVLSATHMTLTPTPPLPLPFSVTFERGSWNMGWLGGNGIGGNPWPILRLIQYR